MRARSKPALRTESADMAELARLVDLVPDDCKEDDPFLLAALERYHQLRPIHNLSSFAAHRCSGGQWLMASAGHALGGLRRVVETPR